MHHGSVLRFPIFLIAVAGCASNDPDPPHGCMKADDQATCVTECTQHQMQGEFDQAGLDCAAEAGTCAAWKLCADTL